MKYTLRLSEIDFYAKTGENSYTKRVEESRFPKTMKAPEYKSLKDIIPYGIAPFSIKHQQNKIILFKIVKSPKTNKLAKYSYEKITE